MIGWLTLILVFQLAGELIAAALFLPLPGPVIGMALLFAFLAVRGGVPEGLDGVGSALIGNLSLLFVPAGVGVIAHLALLEADWPALAAAVIGSTLLAIAVTAGIFVALKRLGGGDSTGSGDGGAQAEETS